MNVPPVICTLPSMVEFSTSRLPPVCVRLPVTTALTMQKFWPVVTVRLPVKVPPKTPVQGAKATPVGKSSTGIVAVIAFVAVEITPTALPAVFATYTLVPSGVMAMSPGLKSGKERFATGIVADTVLVAVAITVTLLSRLVT